MAHLWVRELDMEWAVLSLGTSAWDLSTWPPTPIADRPRDEHSAAILLRTSGSARLEWVLLTGNDNPVRVNGLVVPVGIRVLADRDEIRSRAGSCFFSSEELARAEPFAGSERRLFCPRCKLGIDDGVFVVRCPSCGVWHHQSEKLPCWTYSPTCALCPQPTDAEAGFRWTPQEL